MKRILILASIMLMAVLVVPSFARPDPSSIIHVQPKPGTGWGAGPYFIGTSGVLKISVKPTSTIFNPVENIWLLLVLNDDTWSNLVSITTNVTATYVKGDFRNPDSGTAEEKLKIPVQKDSEGATLYGAPDYPGCEPNERHPVEGLKENMYGSPTGTIYYFIRKATISEIREDLPGYIEINVNAGATELKVMVLAMGVAPNVPNSKGDFNVRTSLTEYTFVVPEIASVFLALAPIAGLCLYTYKQKKTSKNIGDVHHTHFMQACTRMSAHRDKTMKETIEACGNSL